MYLYEDVALPFTAQRHQDTGQQSGLFHLAFCTVRLCLADTQMHEGAQLGTESPSGILDHLCADGVFCNRANSRIIIQISLGSSSLSSWGKFATFVKPSHCLCHLHQIDSIALSNQPSHQLSQFITRSHFNQVQAFNRESVFANATTRITYREYTFKFSSRKCFKAACIHQS